MFDIQSFLKSAAVITAALLPLIMAITTYAGKLGLHDKQLLLCSLISGFLLGVAVMIATLGPPSTFADYLALFLFGLVPGLTASGVYDTGKHLAERASA